MTVRHSPGDWYGLVTPAGLALLPPEVPLTVVEQIWRDLGAGRGLSAVIDGLVGVFGMSLNGLPSFAVISLAESEGVRTALRGDVTAQLWLVGEDDPIAISGSGVTTWNERAFGQAARAALTIAVSEEDSLPVLDGVVRTGRLLVESLTGAEGDVPVRVLPRVAPVGPTPTSRVAPETPSALDPGEARPSEPASVTVRDEDEFSVAESVSASEPAAVPEPVAPEPEVSRPPEPEPHTPIAAPEPETPARIAEPETESMLASPPAEPAPEAVREAETLAADDAPNEYDRLLFGETVLSSVEAAAVRAEEAEPTTTEVSAPAPALPPLPPPRVASDVPPPPPPLPAGLIGSLPSFGPPPPPSATLGDHDGETVLVDDLQSLLGAEWNKSPAQPSAPPVRSLPQLLLPGRAPMPLDRTAIIGTRPRATRVQGDNVPQLVPVGSPNGEISRNHVELRVEGSTVLAVDLNSTNGTILLRAGSDPVRLQPGEPNMLVPGDRVDLGDGVVLNFEGLE